MPVLTREQILQSNTLAREVVPVPEFGIPDGEVIVQEFTGEMRDKFEEGLFNREGEKAVRNFDNFRARTLAMSVVDEEGNFLFTEADIVALGKKSSRALDRIAEVSQRLSGLSKANVETQVGNSDATGGDALSLTSAES